MSVIFVYSWFDKMGYPKSGTISALFKEKSSIKQLVGNYSNIPIKVIKVVNIGVIGVEALEHRSRFKIYKMSFTRILERGK